MPGGRFIVGNTVLIRKDRFQISTNQKIIKADEYAEVVEANRILEKAEARAGEILQKAESNYEQEKKRGYLEGQKEIEKEKSIQMVEIVAQAVDYFGSIEDRVTRIVIDALRKIVGEIDEEKLIVSVVRKVLAEARNQAQVTLRLCPAQVEQVRKRLNDIIADYPLIKFVDLVSDNRLSEGGCIMESDMGFVDASIDVQLAAIEQALTKIFKR